MSRGRTLQINKTLLFNCNGVTFSVKVDDVIYVESYGRKIVLHTKTRETEVYGKISEVEEELGDTFFRSHRSYVVNMNSIAGYSRHEITLDTDEKIPISRYKYKDFVCAYEKFLLQNS